MLRVLLLIEAELLKLRSAPDSIRVLVGNWEIINVLDSLFQEGELRLRSAAVLEVEGHYVELRVSHVAL